jgi:hypothetical protein
MFVKRQFVPHRTQSVSIRNPKERDGFKDLGTDGEIILKWM